MSENLVKKFNLLEVCCAKCKLLKYCERLPERRPDWFGRMGQLLEEMPDGPGRPEEFGHDMRCEKYPIYEHDCDCCEFIARIVCEGRKYDVYRCANNGTEPTWLARYNDEIGGYWSMPEGVILRADMLREEHTQLMQMMRARVEAYQGEGG